MDVTGLTNEELADLMNKAEAERQKRQKDARLRDAAWALVMDAKAHGYNRGQVVQYLTTVIKEAYGNV